MDFIGAHVDPDPVNAEIAVDVCGRKARYSRNTGVPAGGIMVKVIIISSEQGIEHVQWIGADIPDTPPSRHLTPEAKKGLLTG